MNEDKITAKVLAKLMKARKILRDKHPEKTGKNPIFDYFELRDFLPAALDAFDEVGLGSTPLKCSNEEAWIDVIDLESGDMIRNFCPMSTAALPKCHPVQNLGAVKSYLRRYLWMDIMEICEKDPVDSSSSPPAENAQEQVGPTPRAKPPVVTVKTPPRGGQRQDTASTDEIPWRGHLLKVNPVPSENDKGPYITYFITFQLSDGTVKECVTFKENKGTEAQFWPKEDEVIARVRPSARKPGKFDFLGLEQVQPEPEFEVVETE